MKNLLKKIENVLDYADTDVIRVYLGICCLAWGVWSALPFEVLNIPAWRPMIDFWGSEIRVALIPIVVSVFSIATDIGRLKRLKAFASIGVLAWWLFVLTSLLISNPFTTGVPLYGLMSLYSGWMVYRDSTYLCRKSH